MGTDNIIDYRSVTMVDIPSSTPFIRMIATNGVTGSITTSDTTLDGVTPYVVTGTPTLPELIPSVSGSVNIANTIDVSQSTVLGDYKTISDDGSLLWDIRGTGTPTWLQGEHTLAVAIGEYLSMQSYRFHGYVSGNPHLTEVTMVDFAPEVSLRKQVGAYHSDFVAPYNTGYDGIIMRSEGAEVNFDVYRYGTLTTTIPFSSWDNQVPIDWNGFNVFLIDYLWLGGTAVRISEIRGDEKITRHVYKHSGTGKTSTAFGSPNQPVRYQIESLGAVGSFRPVCARVSSGGSIANVGMPGGVKMDTQCNANAVGTKYMVAAIRLKQTHLREAVRELSMSIRASGANDEFAWELMLNPTIAALPAWVSADPNSPIEWVQGDTVNTVTGGYPLRAGTASNRSNGAIEAEIDSQRIIGVNGDGVSDIIAAVVTPGVSNMDMFADFNWVKR